ncbi:hypothetical protein C2845_PM05G18030 [Panicum miliaceum]|uniref:CHCH domain-containing protein n=1 Tax=Panicum miliaceum TaxID=4540 RepID=A0A3L6SWD0_PANMI|nr:hypothetical protein C2845_PM05G18030 [Panicum miliaceum]
MVLSKSKSITSMKIDLGIIQPLLDLRRGVLVRNPPPPVPPCVSLRAVHLFSPAHAEHLQPPYPRAARIADSAYFPWYTASLKCLEANQDKSKCQQQFDDYKECKKKEVCMPVRCYGKANFLC